MWEAPILKNFSEVEGVHPSGGVSPKHRAELMMFQTPICSSICFFKKQQQSAVNASSGAAVQLQGAAWSHLAQGKDPLPVTVRPYRFCSI